METIAPSTPFEAAPGTGVAPPAAPPLAAPANFAVPPGGVLYKVDSSHATFGELWRDSRPSTVWLAWVAKLLRSRLPGSVNDPNVESLRPFEVDEPAVPPDVRARVAPMLRDLRSLGFDAGPPICHAIIDLFNNSRAWLFALPRPDGRAVARVTLRREGSGARPKTHLHCELLSALSDGGFLWSTGAKATLEAPEGICVRRRVGASPAELWSAHERELANLPGAAAVRPAAGREGAKDLLERHHLLVRDFHLRRGLFAPMSEADRQVAASIETTYARASTEGFAFPEIMAEIERLQHKKSSWVGGAVVLVISLLMFLWLGIGKGTGAFASKEAREMLLLLVAILFFHELGHYVAMRVFRYRNVRMFFIPLFGAAVSGTHYSAPGWKKVVVALMGPLPGILVGAGLGIAGMMMHHPLMMKVALMLLILNGANLLPVLPLDGGRVVQSLVFSRHYALDVAFRVVAALALMALVMLPGGRIYLVLGISMLLSVPLVWQRGRIAAELRRAGMAPQSDDQRIPPDLARAIITRVMGGTSRTLKQGNRAVAQTTLAIYESLCNRPPGWLATIGLGAVHVLAVLLAVSLAIFLAVAQGGPLARFARAAAQGPRQSLSPSDIVAVGDHQPAVSRKTIVANFARSAEARSAYIALSQNLGPGEAVERFGQTVLVAFPADDEPARRKHLTDVERLTKEFSVDVPQRGGATFRLNCIVPDAATAELLQAQVQEYTRLPRELHLIPPWSPAASDPRTNWPRCRLARQTYLKLERAGRGGLLADPAQKELDNRIRDAARSGDTAELDRLRAEQTKRMQQRRHDELERLRTLHDGSLDPVVVENYLRLPTGSAPNPDESDDEAGDAAPPGYNNPAYQAIAARMGQLPLANGKPTPGVARFSSYGLTSRVGLLLTFDLWSFEDDVEGAPALVRWLADHGCRSMHYDFHNGNAFENPFE